MTTGTDDPFEAALAALLAPLAQAMVARGLTLGTANEALKKALLEAALATSEGKVSDSKASLLTGIHRKDIKRLRAEESEGPPRRSVNAAALVLSYWATAPEYQHKNGSPRDLPRSGSKNSPGFDELVRQTRADMAPGTVLQALLGQGAVELQEDGRLRLLTHTLLPAAGSAEQVAAYQATLSAHLAAATQNLLAGNGDSRNFDRAVRYSHLSPASVEKLHRLSAQKAQALLEEINAEARALQEKEAESSFDGRFVLGAYILPSPGGTSEEEEET
ncbi:hypothetical protein RA19_21500 [Leisingera sp. ANG-M1]|uniref:DUF6502 family protein n=1 Tax=Leisingera sp. ANG-M1 TaxID=1577895 RepID=UPI00057DAF95|nr:DUF6502 family protein [Leisingera sp. ANG-M1]KIC08017.1 hypothetical protein RA19_21500 [Leisingera sp. ANG-M1]